MMNTRIQNSTRRNILVASACAAALSLFSTSASAQYRIDNSNARDANNRLGSNGFNQSGIVANNGLGGNFITTGNVTAGRAFRGSIGYTDPSAFRGQVSGTSVDNFIRGSAGFGAQGQFVNNAGIARPFFGSSNTVSTPAGFQRLTDGSITAQRNPVARSFDSRIDFGGLTRQEISSTPSRINLLQSSTSTRLSPISGGIGEAMSASSTFAPPREMLPASLTAVDILSEYTALTRRAGNSKIDTTVEKTPDSRVNSTDIIPDSRLNNSSSGTVGSGNPADAVRDPSDNISGKIPNSIGNTGFNTGQSSAVRDMRVSRRVNPQLTELQRRLDDVRKSQSLPGDDAARSIREVNNNLVRERIEAQRQLEEKKGLDDKSKPNAPKAPGTGAGTGAGAGAGASPSPDSSKPEAGKPATMKPDPAAGSAPSEAKPDSTKIPTTPEKPADLNLPMRGTDANLTDLPAAVTPPGTSEKTPENLVPENRVPAGLVPIVPLQVRSISDGTDADAKPFVTRAEELMLEGRFNSAIDQFDSAERIAPEDAMIFMGRSIAELGASYYRRSEVHLRQAYERSPELLVARYDIKSMLGQARLEFLISELKDQASANPQDTGPVLLLAFIYYNVEDTTRAVNLLTEGARRNPNDATIAAMRATWNLPAENK